MKTKKEETHTISIGGNQNESTVTGLALIKKLTAEHNAKMNLNTNSSINKINEQQIKPKVMDEKQKIELAASTQKLIKLAKQSAILNEGDAKAHSQLLSSDPALIRSFILKKVLSVGYENLWKNHGSIMTEIQKQSPELSKFILSARVLQKKLAAKSNDKKFNRKEGIFGGQVRHLVESARIDNIIDEKTEDMCTELLSWEIENHILVENFILLRVEDFDYDKFKKDAPNVLEYIKLFFEDWFDLLIKPRIEKIKKEIDK